MDKKQSIPREPSRPLIAEENRMGTWDIGISVGNLPRICMKILFAEYASALGLGGTVELEGRTMLGALAEASYDAGTIRATQPADQSWMKSGLFSSLRSSLGHILCDLPLIQFKRKLKIEAGLNPAQVFRPALLPGIYGF